MKKDLLRMNLQFFAEEGESASENVSEVAEPIEETSAEVTETEPESVDTEEVAEPQTQSKEANAAFANMRRELEGYRRQQEDLDRMYAQQFGKYTNPETGQPIRNARDYAEAMQAQQRMQARQQLQENNIDPSIIDNMIANSPVVRQAEAAVQELNSTRAQRQLDMDMEEVLKIDPMLSSKEDLLKDPSLPDVMNKVAAGMNLVDAYKLVNFDRLSSSRTAAAKQAVVNQVKGQSHLSNGTSITQTDSLEDIPASMVEMFQEQFPEKSMKELKVLYNKTLSSRKR